MYNKQPIQDHNRKSTCISVQMHPNLQDIPFCVAMIIVAHSLQ